MGKIISALFEILLTWLVVWLIGLTPIWGWVMSIIRIIAIVITIGIIIRAIRK